MQGNKMIVAMDYSKIKNGDYVFTTCRSFVATGIRIVSAGIKNAFNLSIPSHEGIAVWSKIGNADILNIAEMLPGKDSQPGDLKFHPMSSYLQGGYFDPFIISIKRSPYYLDESKSAKLVDMLAQLWQYGKTGYDYSGVAHYILSFIKDDPNKLYCSQLRQMIDREIGFNSVEIQGLDVTPYGHFMSTILKTVLGA
jgi:hypothetical protein